MLPLLEQIAARDQYERRETNTNARDGRIYSLLTVARYSVERQPDQGENVAGSYDRLAVEEAAAQRENTRFMNGDHSSEEVVQKISKPCPSCRIPIEKKGGCLHMKCPECGFDFCWRCSLGWSEHKHCYYCPYGDAPTQVMTEQTQAGNCRPTEVSQPVDDVPHASIPFVAEATNEASRHLIHATDEPSPVPALSLAESLVEVAQESFEPDQDNTEIELGPVHGEETLEFEPNTDDTGAEPESQVQTDSEIIPASTERLASPQTESPSATIIENRMNTPDALPHPQRIAGNQHATSENGHAQTDTAQPPQRPTNQGDRPPSLAARIHDLADLPNVSQELINLLSYIHQRSILVDFAVERAVDIITMHHRLWRHYGAGNDRNGAYAAMVEHEIAGLRARVVRQVCTLLFGEMRYHVDDETFQCELPSLIQIMIQLQDLPPAAVRALQEIRDICRPASPGEVDEFATRMPFRIAFEVHQQFFAKQLTMCRSALRLWAHGPGEDDIWRFERNIAIAQSLLTWSIPREYLMMRSGKPRPNLIVGRENIETTLGRLLELLMEGTGFTCKVIHANDRLENQLEGFMATVV
jgi:predicted RNA-binding Zn-ribbon protein involved in translation (DUF1610 family)